ncbi:hypothetical protein INT08_08780 [Prosthecochloris sp. N3]|uniref:Tetratricopeptide repeat-like domain-containing protein n=1 Tax=Prosthecochloris ethylica TaxID=2743976 RepID=A0ABR9XTE8_9CHLB|nr:MULTISPECIES: hypothetical protein [Prosthecochloris]MEC9486053.1 hypothetical protein [Prosthecochloris sp.]MBF0587186.1 hypothetical protein [Prosthecochloris ethylica]MBF0637264.1 hypothetical protein [Prosthecochloris ethylica]NUK48455.1 hypothetical protein [Prosthecochloris ethylica]RNA64551.1 hypothetical protein CR163_004430 [Prosthecochloris sp. ZM_2]
MTEQERQHSTPQEETDSLAHKADLLLAWLMKYQKQMIAAGVVIVLAAAGIFYLFQQQRAQEREASRLLGFAIANIDNGNMERAIEGDSLSVGLAGIADTYSSTESGQLARLFEAKTLLALDRPDEALTASRSFSGSTPDLKAAALACAAESLERLAEPLEAAQQMEKAGNTAENHALKAIYLADAAALFAAAEETAQAITLLHKVEEQYPGTTGAARAQQKLQQLSATADTER